MFSLYLNVCLFVLACSCVSVYVRISKHVFVSLTFSLTEREWYLFQSYNIAKCHIERNKALCLECGENVANSLLKSTIDEKKDVEYYAYKHERWCERISVAGKCHPFDSEYAHRIFFYLYILLHSLSLYAMVYIHISY